MALHIGIGNFAGGTSAISYIYDQDTYNVWEAIASNIYRSQDAPRYILGRAYIPLLYPATALLTLLRCMTDALELMFVGIGFVFLPLVVFLYTRINAHRDKLQREMEEKGIKYTPEEIREMGDRAPDFRYTL